MFDTFDCQLHSDEFSAEYEEMLEYEITKEED